MGLLKRFEIVWVRQSADKDNESELAIRQLLFFTSGWPVVRTALAFGVPAVG